MTIDITKLKETLIKEQESLETELRSVGRINPDNANDWEPVAGELNIEPAEIEERASEISDFEERHAIEFTLEGRYNSIKAALTRIEEGTYGNCIVCGKPIEEDRLSVNPSAETCKEHMDIMGSSAVLV